MYSAPVKENSSKFPGDAGFRWPPVQVVAREVAAGEVSVERELGAYDAKTARSRAGSLRIRE
jgi:hypothetical protein